MDWPARGNQLMVVRFGERECVLARGKRREGEKRSKEKNKIKLKNGFRVFKTQLYSASCYLEKDSTLISESKFRLKVNLG